MVINILSKFVDKVFMLWTFVLIMTLRGHDGLIETAIGFTIGILIVEIFGRESNGKSESTI